jgi:hypothetical protein
MLCSLGYETRSIAAATHRSAVSPLFAIGFPGTRDEVYERNRNLLSEDGAQLDELDDDAFATWVAGWLEKGWKRIAIDISSMNRSRIAATVQALQWTNNEQLVVDFLYVPQRYESGPPKTLAASALEPVTPEFAGWYTDTGSPLVVLFGLGFEPLRAAGAIDMLEPERAIPFFPVGSESQFIDDVERNNHNVFDLPMVEAYRRYQIAEPFACFAELDSLVSLYAEQETRLLLLPLGPKIFALICILVASTRDPLIPVWRVSRGAREDPIDVQPSDMLVTLRVSPRPILGDEESGQSPEAALNVRL